MNQKYSDAMNALLEIIQEMSESEIEDLKKLIEKLECEI